MRFSKFSRQFKFLILAFVVGLTSSYHVVLAKSDDELEWKKVKNPEIDLSLQEQKVSDEPKQDSIYQEDDVVRVMIVFEDKDAIEKGYSTKNIAKNKKALQYVETLESKQVTMTKKISQKALNGKKLSVLNRFTLFTNGVSAEVTYKDIKKIKKVDGVADVFVLPKYEVQAVADADPHTITSGEMVGSYNTWNAGYSGAGQRIAVIDTGIDLDHPSFDGDALHYALLEEAKEDGKSIQDYDLLDVEEIQDVLDLLNAEASADALYCNEKVAFGYNYVDSNLDITHDHDSQGDHGTHVSGIATANEYVKVQDTYSKQENGVVGIAPDAQLLAMKVFGTNGGAYSDDYMAAMQDAILLGADTINLSLGSANGGNSKEFSEAESYINEIFNQLSKTDTVVAISSGNAGTWAENSALGGLHPSDVNLQTNGSPGSYTNALTVASADNTGNTGYAVKVKDTAVYYTDGKKDDGTLPPFYSLDTTNNGTSYEFVLMDRMGSEKDYEQVDVSGKIAIVSRGEIAFTEKHEIAVKNGAIGVLIYNNEPGTINMDMNASKANVPCASITMADAQAIRNQASTEKDGIYTGTMIVSSKISTSYDENAKAQMSSFSSWGVPGDLSLKPEITAPGGNIYSTLDNGGYGLMSGTSMASPSVAGMGALLLQYINENNLSTITGVKPRALAQSLLMSTAVPLKEADQEAYSPRKQGAGMANIEYATTSPVYVLMNQNGEDGKVKAELGDDPDRTGLYTFTFTLYNMTDEVQYYTYDSEILTEDVVDGLVRGTSYRLHPTVTLSGSEKLYDLNDDDQVDSKDAELLLKVVNGSAESEKVMRNQTAFDLNQSGKIDTADVHHFLLKMKNQDEVDQSVIAVNDKKEVTVTIALSKDDKAYLDQTFENGMYVDGFIYLDGTVDLSIPLLAFYGNWADASMFDHSSYLSMQEDEYSYLGYSKQNPTNFLTYIPSGEQDEYLFGGNEFVEDDAYLPQRNAMNSNAVIKNVHYSLIRNSAYTKITVQNQESKKIYKEVDLGDQYAAFYHDGAAAWQNTQISGKVNWNASKLAEGTKVYVDVTALPEYNEPNKESGKGTVFRTPITIDNSEPELVSGKKNEKDAKKIDVVVKDNEYVAAVLVLNRSMDEVLSRHAVNQKEANQEMEITIPVDNKVLYLAVVDYAGNMSTYLCNNTGQDFVEETTGITLNQNDVVIMPGESMQLKAYVTPENILDDSVVWTSDNESVVMVDENGVVTGLQEGTATVKATTKALNANGQHESAVCQITVDRLYQQLTSLIYRQNDTYWGNYQVKTPDQTTNLAQAELPLWNATPYQQYLMGIMPDGKNGTSFYVIDPNKQFKTLGEFGTLNGAELSALAYSDVFQLFFATSNHSILLIDFNSGQVQELDFTEISAAALNGIVYMGFSPSEKSDVFAVTTVDGDVYLMFLQLDGKIGIGQLPNKLDETLSDTYNSLYYNDASGNLFWSAYDGNKTTFYAVSAIDGSITEIKEMQDARYVSLIDGTYGKAKEVKQDIQVEKMQYLPLQASSLKWKQSLQTGKGGVMK